MKSTFFFLVLLAVAVATSVQAQEMNVIRWSGQVDEFSLAEIDSITFSEHDSLAASGLRDVLQSTGDILRVHTASGISQFLVTNIDSVCFADELQMIIHQGTGDSSFNLAEVDSLTFASSSSSFVSIAYSGATVTVDNPFETLGVTVEVDAADVIVTAAAGIEGIDYVLSGSSTDGMFKIYSDHDFNLHLDGVTLTNQDGPPINIQAHQSSTVELVDGTTTTLTDGVTYADPPSGEDQKAPFFSEGELIFTGTGSLIVHGLGDDKHALASDDYVDVHSGSIVIQSAVKDGVHTNDGYFQQGGSLEVVTSGSDGIDAGDGPVEISGGTLTILNEDNDSDALKCDGDLVIAGGTVDLTVEGDQSKGLNAVNIELTGGTVTIETSGDAVLEPSGLGYDPSYCTAAKADDQVLLDGCQLTVTTVGQAGRGISCDGDIVIQSGSVNITSSGGGSTYVNELGEADAYHGPCLKADGDVVFSGGTVTLSHSGSGGKGIAGDGDLTICTTLSSPTLHITTTGASIPIGFDEAAEAKAISVDSTVTIDNGDLTISSADDAIKSKYWLEVNGGLINIVNCVEGLESPNLFINGGEIHLTSTDDGLNATYGIDGEFNDGSNLTINGGYVHLNAPSGDGIDSNGNLTINGGTIIVHGPPGQPEVGLDVNGTFLVNGSFLVVSQTNSMMLEVPSGSSTQRSVLLRTNQAISSGTLFHIEDTGGTSLVTFEPGHGYSAILFSSSDLTGGTTYRVYTGGSCTGVEQDGLYIGGTYSGGTLRTTFTSSGMVQTVNF
jgi:hypothetical protein